MPDQPFRALGLERRPVDINVMKRNMSVAKGFLDISLLAANATQLRNVLRFGNENSNLHYLILTGIIISIILQVSSGVVLILSERFDINKEDEQHRGDVMNTVTTSLIFLVLVINVFVASLGVDFDDRHHHHHHPDHHVYPKGLETTTPTYNKDGIFNQG